MCTTVFIDWLYIRPPMFNSVLSIRGQRCSIVSNRVQLCCTVFCHIPLCSTVFYRIPLSSTLFHRVLSYPTMFQRVPPCFVVSHCVFYSVLMQLLPILFNRVCSSLFYHGTQFTIPQFTFAAASWHRSSPGASGNDAIWRMRRRLNLPRQTIYFLLALKRRDCLFGLQNHRRLLRRRSLCPSFLPPHTMQRNGMLVGREERGCKGHKERLRRRLEPSLRCRDNHGNVFLAKRVK